MSTQWNIYNVDYYNMFYVVKLLVRDTHFFCEWTLQQKFQQDCVKIKNGMYNRTLTCAMSSYSFIHKISSYSGDKLNLFSRFIISRIYFHNPCKYKYADEHLSRPLWVCVEFNYARALNSEHSTLNAHDIYIYICSIHILVVIYTSICIFVELHVRNHPISSFVYVENRTLCYTRNSEKIYFL